MMEQRKSIGRSFRGLVGMAGKLAVENGTKLARVFFGRPGLAGMALLCCGLANNGWAANWYVRPGGAGSRNGTDWNNAWDSGGIGWGSVRGGDTVWLAGGTYVNPVRPTQSGSAGNLIYCKRVVSTDSVPTSAAGWNSAFDSQVIIAPASGSVWFYNTVNVGSYMYIDGRMDSGISLRKANTAGENYPGCVNFTFGAGFQHDITFTNIDMAGPEGSTPIKHLSYDNNFSITCWNGSSMNVVSNILVTHCRLHGANELLAINTAHDIVFDHCKFYDNVCTSDSAGHQNILELPAGYNLTWRYCEFYNWAVEGFMLAGGVGALYVYGCTWHDAVSVGRCFETYPTSGPLYCYNNTFVNIPYIVYSAGQNWAPGSVLRNNIYWNCNIGSLNGADQDYEFSNSAVPGAHSISSGSNPFVNLAGKDFHIVSTIGAAYPRNKGAALGAPYNVDPDGNIRGADGSWDIGACEYAGGVSTTPVIAVSPASQNFGSVNIGTSSNLTFTVKNAGSGTLSGNATVSGPFSIASGNAYSLGAGQSQTVTVSYSPTNAVSSTQTVTFTGGGGATASVIGTGAQPTTPVVAVSPASQNFGSVTIGTSSNLTLTVKNTGSGTLSGSATVAAPFSIVSGGTYSLGGGQSQTVTVSYSPTTAVSSSQTVTFTGGAGATVSVTGTGLQPITPNGLAFPVTAGSITAPFTIANGILSQSVDVELGAVTNTGWATYSFTVTNAGSYVIQALVNAPNLGSKSFYINIDSPPTDPVMIWDVIPLTSGFEQRFVSWRGNGTYAADQYTPKVFDLNAGTHQLIICGREAYVQLQSLSLVRLPSAPQNLRVVAGQ